MPRVWPDHPKVLGGFTSRITDEIVKELAFQRNDVPSAKGPAMRATFTAEFQVGHLSTSQSKAHRTVGSAFIVIWLEATTGARLLTSMDDNS
jgi:hypothetical protein